MLYLISTPIGNLEDITFRAIELLKKVDYILCEDTRHSIKLLNHYGIATPLKSYHKFNEKTRLDSIISDLKSGMQIGLISDAGTPAIADPGADLVFECIKNDIPVTPISGPCALIHGLIASGLPTTSFQFIGFLPKKKNELVETLSSCLKYRGTTICYESPQRLEKTLREIHSLNAYTSIVVARELSKKFESYQRGTAKDLLHFFEEHPPKGEIVLLLHPQSTSLTPSNDGVSGFDEMSIAEHVLFCENHYGLSRSEAMKKVSKLRNLPRNLIYREMLSQKIAVQPDDC